MSAAPFSFQDFQRDFARYLRDPHHTPRPQGVPARRAAVYEELLFNNVCGFLDKCFPVCREILGQARWRRLNRCFYRDWPMHSPLFRYIPREFVAYLAAGEPALRLPAWMAELAHYEWAELAADIMPVCAPEVDESADLLESVPVPNPTLMNLAYTWPVHRIGPDFKPRKPEATFIAVFRDGEQQVRFSALNAVTSRLLAILTEDAQTGRAALEKIAQELQHPNPAQLINFGRTALEDLRSQGILAGARR